MIRCNCIASPPRVKHIAGPCDFQLHLSIGDVDYCSRSRQMLRGWVSVLCSFPAKGRNACDALRGLPKGRTSHIIIITIIIIIKLISNITKDLEG